MTTDVERKVDALVRAQASQASQINRLEEQLSLQSLLLQQLLHAGISPSASGVAPVRVDETREERRLRLKREWMRRSREAQRKNANVIQRHP